MNSSRTSLPYFVIERAPLESFSNLGTGSGPMTAVTVSVSAGNLKSICPINCEDGPGMEAAAVAAACKGNGCRFAAWARWSQREAHWLGAATSGT